MVLYYFSMILELNVGLIEPALNKTRAVFQQRGISTTQPKHHSWAVL